MLLFTKRQLMSVYLCRLSIYSGLPFVAHSSTAKEINRATEIYSTKENISASTQDPWFARPFADSGLMAVKLSNEISNEAFKKTTQAANKAVGLEKLEDLTDILHWGTSVLLLVQKYQQNPLRASRILSYVQVGMHDAWVLTQASSAKNSSNRELSSICEYACHRTASLLMGHFYPNESAARFEAEFVYLTAKLNLSSQHQQAAFKMGNHVAEQLKERSWQDGSARVWKDRKSVV